MIRIAHIITRFHGAGGAKNTLFTCAGLDKTRFEVDLVVGASADAWRAQGIGVNWVQIPALRRDLHPLADARAARDLLALCRRRRYHIVHTHLAKAGILGRWAARRAGVPIILHSLHGATFHDRPSERKPGDWLYYGLERLAAPWTDGFVSVGEDLKRRYLAAGVGAASQYVVIHSGMNLDAFRAAGRMGEEQRQAVRAGLGYGPEIFLAGYVAALEWRKGHRYLIEVLRRLAGPYPQLRLVFVGEGYDRARIEALAAQAGLSGRIQFTGYRTDVAEVMAALDVKLFASSREGLPQVLVQAAAVGLPVLAFAAEGVADLVKDGVNGHVFAYGDVDGMTAALERLLQQPQEARRLGAAGPALVDDRWQIDAMQTQTQALYDAWLEAKGLP